jgi:hypothetical protein
MGAREQSQHKDPSHREPAEEEAGVAVRMGQASAWTEALAGATEAAKNLVSAERQDSQEVFLSV